MKARWCCLCAVLWCAALIGSRVLAPQPATPAIDAPSQCGTILEQYRRAGQLEREWEALIRRQHARQSIIEDLLAGRLSLARAVERFESLNQLPPDCRTALRNTYPCASDTECARRQVGCYLQQALAEQPDKADVIRQRLETQGIEAVQIPYEGNQPLR